MEANANDVSLDYDPHTGKLLGRGELHLGILFENMRREGFEFELSPPEIIMKEVESGALLEPFENLHLEFEKE